MPDLTITPFQDTELTFVVDRLRKALSCEAISEASFARKVLLDPNFDREGALVAHKQDGGIVGFILALVRRRPLEDAPADAERGWITLFGVSEFARKQGVGTALLNAAEDWLRAQGRREVWISPYAPNYWTPGVDETAYAEGLDFLHRHGYATAYRPLSMEVSLVGWQQPEWLRQNKIQMEMHHLHLSSEYYQPCMAGQVTDFLRNEFPGDWQRYVRETMLEITAGKRPREELRLLFENREFSNVRNIVAFAQSEGERFGPFGVAKAWRGKGLGAMLLAQMLEDMRTRGLHHAWFLWTDDNTAERLYKPAGFRETRRYAVLHKHL